VVLFDGVVQVLTASHPNALRQLAGLLQIGHRAVLTFHDNSAKGSVLQPPRCSESAARRPLDHIVIAVHDLDGAGRAYSALGFAVVSGAHISFYFRS
jgi:hypothetical protein